LREFGVELGRDIVLNPQSREPTVGYVVGAKQADSSIPETFRRGAFPIQRLRTVRPLGQEGAFAATPMLELYKQQYPYQWAEDKLVGSPKEFMDKMKSEHIDEIEAKAKLPAATVAVTVREKGPANPGDPHASFRQSEGEPRLVVIGNASMVTNRNLSSRDLAGVYYKFFTSSLAWVRGRANMMGTDLVKTRSDYKFKIDATKYSTLVWVPGPTLLMVIAGCGLGVWFMRRR